MKTYEEVYRVMDKFAEYGIELIWWIDEGSKEVSASILCSDLFYMSGGDEVIVENEDIGLLRVCYRQLIEVAPQHIYYLRDLFCAMKEKKRPQGYKYHHRIPEDIHFLFDACGPEREHEIDNPYRQDGTRFHPIPPIAKKRSFLDAIRDSLNLFLKRCQFGRTDREGP